MAERLEKRIIVIGSNGKATEDVKRESNLALALNYMSQASEVKLPLEQRSYSRRKSLVFETADGSYKLL